MNAQKKKKIGRNIHQFLTPNDQLLAFDRETGKEKAIVQVTAVTRDEIKGLIIKKTGFPGIPVRFRVPQLTQRGGNLRIQLKMEKLSTTRTLESLN